MQVHFVGLNIGGNSNHGGALNKIQFIMIIKTPTCFGTSASSSGSNKIKEY